MNRSDFLIRLLHYYRDVGFTGNICISDSSNAEHVDRIKKAIQTLKGQLKIVYQEYPYVNDIRGQVQLIDSVSTPYVALVPDDDFLIPATIDRCIKFLDSHADYSAAHGVGIALTLKSSTPYGQITRLERYQQTVREEETASQRLFNHLSNYTVSLFSVHRIEAWRAMYRDAALLKEKAFSWELLPCCLSVILGKVKELDYLYLVRQIHERRYHLRPANNWLTDLDWPNDYNIFVNCLAKEVTHADNIDQGEAINLVKTAFQVYLDKTLIKPEQGHLVISRLKQLAGMVPGAQRIWSHLHPMKQPNELSLADLLKPSFHYYDDFIPIYKNLTTVPVDTEY